jgi:hypothetical protein
MKYKAHDIVFKDLTLKAQYQDNLMSQQGPAERQDPVLRFQKGHTEQTNERSGNFFPGDQISQINSTSWQKGKASSNVFLGRTRFRVENS